MPLNHDPESELVADSELRAALQSHRLDAVAFAAGVHARIEAAEAERAHDPLAHAPQLLRVAAALLPMPLTGNASAMPLVQASGLDKLLGYVALPAFSLFVLPAAALFGAVTIHQLQKSNSSDNADPQVSAHAAIAWARQHKWLLRCLFACTLALAWIGATSVMLLLYLTSLGVLLYLLSGLVKLGLGQRSLIGQSCLMGLVLLGQVSAFCGIGEQDIHLVDQLLVASILFAGALVLLPFVLVSLALPNWQPNRAAHWLLGSLLAVLVLPVLARLASPLLWPATPEQIKRHVEAFDSAPFSTASWQKWEFVACWAIEAKLEPDLTGARWLLAEEIVGAQNPFILGNAFRVGLVQAEQVRLLRNYDEKRHALLGDPHGILVSQPILSLAQVDWVIRAAALREDLSPRDRDYLARRLHATLADLATGPYEDLETALRVTQLLDTIQRPIDRDRYREEVHALLRKFHSTKGGGFQVAGGFRQYVEVPVGSVEATAYAVELMMVYGIPEDLDVNWVRSFLRPRVLNYWTADRWINAVTLNRLNRLPGVMQPTWLEIVYYERSLIMAVLLVALCIYATLSSPASGRSLSAARST